MSQSVVCPKCGKIMINRTTDGYWVCVSVECPNGAVKVK